MHLLPVRHLWGVTAPLTQSIPHFASLGYKAIETPLAPGTYTELLPLLKAHNLAHVPMGFTTGSTVAEHLTSFRAIVAEAKKTSPLFLNVHSGLDRFSLKEALAFYCEATHIEASEGITITHETHRGRVFYNPWRTAEVLQEVPGVKLACDYSHWTVVTESLLETEEKELTLAAQHCYHLHARVGYSQGPQVPDPSAPEYNRELLAHEQWWKQIWTIQQQKGFATSTFTPEFGPPTYLHTLPHSNHPVADLQQICEWMNTRVKQTFAQWSGGQR